MGLERAVKTRLPVAVLRQPVEVEEESASIEASLRMALCLSVDLQMIRVVQLEAALGLTTGRLETNGVVALLADALLSRIHPTAAVVRADPLPYRRLTAERTG